MPSFDSDACGIAVAQIRKPARYGERSRETIRRIDLWICRQAAVVFEMLDMTRTEGSTKRTDIQRPRGRP
jgi:hypothetical protein